MITPITDEEFGERQERLGSRWAKLIELLRSAKVGDSFEIKLEPHENTGAGRRRVRQSIYAIARYHKIDISLRSSAHSILVKKLPNPRP